jgi:hypothetical protein
MFSDPAIDQAVSRTATESAVSAISWPAIFGGATAATSLSVVLALLGSGLGFALVSPWPNAGASASTFTIAAGLWLIVVQWLSSGLGGFITGRLRTKWVRVHTHEVFFRDTAHGLLTWSLASVIGAILVISAGSSAIGTGIRAAGTMTAAPLAQVRSYDADMLFRGEKADQATSDSSARTEAVGIFAHIARTGDIPQADRDYLADQVTTRTGLSQVDAKKRVDDVIVQYRQTADAARKSAAAISIFSALSMLIGAFIASAAASYGGSLRDEHD